MKHPVTTVLTATALLLGSQSALAQDNAAIGPYVGFSLGASGIDLGTINRAESGDTDHTGTPGKISAGYWFTEHWGVEANYADLGEFTQAYTGGVYKGSAKSWGVSLLGRVPVGERWSFVGKVNITDTDLEDNGSTGNTAGFDKLNGGETSLVLPGLEVNYAMNPRATFFLELDPRGSASEKIDLGYVGVGVRVSF